MKASSFLGDRTAAVLPEGALSQADRGSAEKMSENLADSSLTSPATPSESTVVIRDTTPNGTEIAYCADPRGYWVNGVSVPSVTTVLGILNKPQLVWWGQGRGVQGVIDLFDLGALTTGIDWETENQYIAIPQGEDATRAEEAEIVDLLKQHKLTVNHRLDKASERGVNVHDALEDWARLGSLPNVREFPPEEQGYVTGLLNFIEGREIQPVACEVMVGIDERGYGYAGRFDLVLEISEPVSLVTKCYPKRQDKRTEVLPGRYLVDLKTSKGVYTTHHLQLAAYEFAAVECGYPATDGQAVLHVTSDGKYEFVLCKATPGQFLSIRQAYGALEKMKEEAA